MHCGTMPHWSMIMSAVERYQYYYIRLLGSPRLINVLSASYRQYRHKAKAKPLHRNIMDCLEAKTMYMYVNNLSVSQILGRESDKGDCFHLEL